MKKPSLPGTAIIIGILLVASISCTYILITHADFSDTDWQLTVTGLVDHPLNLTLSEIAAMPQTTFYAQLICVGSPDTVVTAGNWMGVKLSLLLEKAGASPNTTKVAFYAKDGFSTDLSLANAESDLVILAYEKDGVPLSETLRLVVPERWGYKWIAQVTRIELVNYNFLGAYESQGYPDDALVTFAGVPSFPYPNPSSASPSTSPSPISSNSSNPIASNSSSPIPSLTPGPKSNLFSPTNASYATAAVIAIAGVVAVAVVFKKRAKQETHFKEFRPTQTTQHLELPLQHVDRFLYPFQVSLLFVPCKEE